MKKVVNHPKELRLKGVVENDGVGFLPEREAGPFLLKTSGYFATADNEGDINSRVLSVNVYEDENMESPKSNMDGKINSQSKLIVAIAIVAIVSSLVMMVVSVGWANAKVWFSVFATLTYLFWIVLLLPKACSILLKRVFRDQEMREFSKYLGAKNAVENAYYDLGRAPNMEEVKDYSRYSSDCKYTKNGYIACLALVVSCVQFLDGVWYWIAAVLAAVIMCALEWKNHLVFWQALVVSTPSEKHYKVAIRAMEETAELIDSVEVSYHDMGGESELGSFNEEKCEGCPVYDFCKKNNQENKSEEKAEDEEDHEQTVNADC